MEASELSAQYWAIVGFCSDARLGECYKALWLKTSDGNEFLAFDCFGELWRISNKNFKITSVEANGVTLPHFINTAGQLCVTEGTKNHVLCPWTMEDPSVQLKGNKLVARKVKRKKRKLEGETV